MKTALSDILLQKGLITQSERANIQRGQLLSVHWDLRSLLYLGVVLVTTAIGILVYKNIDTIGHQRIARCHCGVVMFAGLVLGVILLGISVLSQSKNIKTHFAFTYRNFGIHLFFIFLLAILFYYDRFYLLTFLVLSVATFFLFKNAIKGNSFYFLVVTILYFYIGLSYVTVCLLSINAIGNLYGIILYFIFSGIGLIAVFKNLQKKLKV